MTSIRPVSKSRKRGQRGAAFIELSLSVSVLALLVVWVVDVSRLFNMANRLNQAARSGAQFGAYSTRNASNTAGIQNAAVTAAPGLTMSVAAEKKCLCGDVAYDCTQTVSCASHPKIYVQVETGSTFDFIMDYPGLPRSIPLKAKTALRAK